MKRPESGFSFQDFRESGGFFGDFLVVLVPAVDHTSAGVNMYLMRTGAAVLPRTHCAAYFYIKAPQCRPADDALRCIIATQGRLSFVVPTTYCAAYS